MKKKTLQTNIVMNVCMTIDCIRPTQSSVIQIIHCNVDLKCFFPILPKCLFVISYTCIFHSYFTR